MPRVFELAGEMANIFGQSGALLADRLQFGERSRTLGVAVTVAPTMIVMIYMVMVANSGTSNIGTLDVAYFSTTPRLDHMDRTAVDDEGHAFEQEGRRPAVKGRTESGGHHHGPRLFSHHR